MAARINGITGTYTVPNVNRIKYKFSAFDGPTIEYTEQAPNGQPIRKSVNTKRLIEDAWRFAAERAAGQKACNDYFRTLPRKKTLREVLDEGAITFHCLVPKANYTFDDLPEACTAGRDIGFNPMVLIQNQAGLAGTLIHELAHVAGASTNPDASDARSIAAETALLHCGCRQQFRKEAIGSIGFPSPEGSRMA